MTDQPVPPPVVVEIEQVSKRFTVRKDSSIKERIVTLGRAGRRHKEDYWALNDVTVDIHAGSTVGLIGHNGSGKSTMLKVIGGIIQPTTGEVRQRGRIAALLELGAGFHPDLTGRENVFLNAALLGLSRAETESRFAEILDFSGVGDFIDTQVKFYSSGMYVRLAFAVAVHTDPDILLVDEVLAVGDEAFQRKCLDKISEFQAEGRAIVFVSHALDQIESLCDRVLLLNQGQVVYDGLPATAIGRFRELLRAEIHRDSHRERSVNVLSIEGVEVRPAGDGAALHVTEGDSFVLRITVRASTPVEKWDLGFSIDTSHGHMAMASNTELIGVELEPLHGTRTVELVVAAPLGTGSYSVNANVEGRSVSASHAVMNATHFVVKGGSQTIGPVAGAITLR